MANPNLTVTADFAKQLAVFAINMYSSIALEKPNENIVISPFSIQTCAAMARVGAENETASELDRGLGLSNLNMETMTSAFYNILSAYEHSEILKIANKIYVNDKFTLEPVFNEVLSKKFLSSAESINFLERKSAVDKINKWAEEKTNHIIKNLVAPEDVGDATRIILINAIHFKGQWRKKFNAAITENEDFFLNEEDKVKVPMMRAKDHYRYAHLPELKAAVLEMPYKDSDLSMLIILPDSRTGLKDVEKKLNTIDISDIVKKMESTLVLVSFPKFKIETSLELTEPFKKMGISRMFTDNAEFGKMLKPEADVKVSKIIHKAFIEVDEEGTEAAAATGMHMRKKRSMPIEIDFIAEHPFIYVVTSIIEQTAYTIFMGSLNTPVATSESKHDEL